MNAKTRSLIIFVVLVILVPVFTYPGMIGRVIDAETGEPIEGAVIMAEWTKTKGLPGLTHTESYKVFEDITGKNGWAWISGVYNPTVELSRLAVYKKGYVAWNKDDIFPDYKKRTDFHWCCFYKVIKLDRFKPEYSYNDHTSFIDFAIGSGLSEKKLLEEAYSWERTKASRERDLLWREKREKRNSQ